MKNKTLRKAKEITVYLESVQGRNIPYDKQWAVIGEIIESVN